MAKGPLFISTFKGKLGNIVGYTLKDSNDKVVQATRVYQPNVANPKTEPQVIQRLKMAPGVNFYRQLSRILDNSWQGQRYGVKSRQYFMSQAMKQATGIPFIVKGDKRFYPGEYPVSQGSLVSVAVNSISTDLLSTSLVSGGVTGTWGEVSQGLVNKNFGIKNGDKLTFIFVGKNALDEYVPAFSYVILDTASTTQASVVLTASNLTFAGAADSNLTVGILNAISDIVAGAVIVSRLDELSGTIWQRSNSIMFCSDEYKEVMMSASAYEAAASSYMDSNLFDSSWYLNQGISGGNYSFAPGGNSGSNLTVVSASNLSFPSGDKTLQVAIAVMSDGTHRAYASDDDNRILIIVGNSLERSSNTATAQRLLDIQAEDALVLGWIYATPSSSSGGGETPEP